MTPLTKSSDIRAVVTTTDQCSNCGAVLTNAETSRREWQQAASELSKGQAGIRVEALREAVSRLRFLNLNYAAQRIEDYTNGIENQL